MDDAFGWGSSVWSAADEASSSKSPLEEPPQPISISKLNFAAADNEDHDNAFDDFDDFSNNTNPPANDDDFGDFGDFDDGANGGVEGFQNGFDTIPAFPEDDLDGFGASSNNWRSLRVQAGAKGQELTNQVEGLLEPLWRDIDTSRFTDDDLRQMGTLSQTLVTRESAELYGTLFQQPLPTIELPGWTRSRIRRQYLVSLGIPVNLDEVLPRANIKALPQLELHTRPSSAPPIQRNTGRPVSHVSSSSRANSRTRKLAGDRADGANGSAPAAVEAALGPKPEFDEEKATRLLSLTADTLRLLPLSNLQNNLSSLQSLTADASALLAYLLQNRDISQQDSETYNGLIAEMVGEAQKWKAQPSKSRTSLSRKSTLKDNK